MTEIAIREADQIQREDDLDLRAGQYWQSLDDIPEYLTTAGMILLVQSIKYVDNNIHTVVLRAHPSVFGDRCRTESDTWGVTVDMIEMLVGDFLLKFKPAPHGPEDRKADIDRIMSRVTDAQRQLADLNQRPDDLERMAIEHLNEYTPDWEAEAEPKPAPEITGAASNTTALALTDSINMKREASRMIAIAEAKGEVVKSIADRIQSIMRETTPYYKEQGEATLAGVEDTLRQAEEIGKGVESLDLFLLEGVEIEKVREGESAPKDIPLTLVQQHLCAETELCLHQDLGDWFDVSDTNKLYNALKESDDFVNQIFPTQRCIVMMSLTERDLNYREAHDFIYKNKHNRETFLLIRDGENIHLVFSPIKTHQHAKRLFPRRDTEDQIFKGTDGTRITYEDVRYADALSEHDELIRHYKRILLLMCGLDHQHRVFGTFYDGPQDMRFMTLEFQEQYMRFLSDEDGSDMLPVPEMEDVNAWIGRQNRYAGPGSRIYCHFNRMMTIQTAPTAFIGRNREFGDENAYRQYDPKDEYGVRIATKKGNDLRVSTEVTGFSYKLGNYRTFDCSIRLDSWKNYDDASSRPVAKWVCLDRIRPEEIDAFLLSRQSRKIGVGNICLLKQVRDYLLEERKTEASAEREIISMMHTASDRLTEADKTEIARNIIRIWRADNKGIQTPTPTEKGWAAFAGAAAQLLLPVMLGEQRILEAAQDYCDQNDLTPLHLAVSGAGAIDLFTITPDDEADDRLVPHIWVTRHRVRKLVENRKFSFSRCAKSQQRYGRYLNAEHILQRWDDNYDAWFNQPAFKKAGYAAYAFASPAVKAAAMESCHAGVDFLERLSDCSAELWEHLLSELHYIRRREKAAGMGNSVYNPAFIIPIGMRHGSSAGLHYIVAGTEQPEIMLYQLAKTDDQRDRIHEEYISRYHNEAQASERFEDAVEKLEPGHGWLQIGTAKKLAFHKGKSAATGQQCYFANYKLGRYSFVAHYSGYKELNQDPLASSRIADLNKPVAEGQHECALYLDPRLDPNAGGAHDVIDTLLGCSRPDDYMPTLVYSYKIFHHETNATLFHFWDVVAKGQKYNKANKDEDDLSGKFPGVKADDIYVRSYDPSYYTSRAKAIYWESQKNVNRGIKPSTELDGLPQPEEGVDRYYATGCGEAEI